MADPSLRSASAFVDDITNNTITLAKPAGTVDGDVLVAVFSLDNSSDWTVNPPTRSGWSVLGALQSSTLDGHELYALYKVASGEPSTMAFTHVSNQRWSAVMLCYQNVDTSGSPIDVTGGASDSNNNASPITITGPSLTTTTARTLVVQLMGGDPTSNTTGSWSAPSGYSTDAAGYAAFIPLAAFSKLFTSAGATGTAAATLTPASGNAGWMVINFALKGVSGASDFPPVPEPPFVHANLNPILAR